MKIIFNELGVITSIDTTDEPIRQGNVGVNNLIVDFSQMNGVNNLDYACVFTYVRPDKSKINDVIMLSSAENTKYFEFNFSNKWFFELYGDASITVKLLKDNTVLANGEFNIVIEKTSADNEPQITYNEYLHLVESITKTQQDAKQYTDDSVQALKDLVSENYAEKTYVDNQLNLCVKLTDIDADLSLTSTNPIQNKVVSKQIKDINYTIMTIKEELFETILSEVDYKVDYATIYPIPDTLSDDDGTHRVVYSDTQLKEIEGNSVAFNQLVQNGNFVDNSNWTVGGANLSVSNNVATITPTAIHSYFRQKITLINGHKYLYKIDIKYTNGESYYINIASISTKKIGNGQWESKSAIITPTNSNNLFSIYDYDDDIHSPYQVKNAQLFDLTLMGLDSITSVEEFNRIFPNDYYPYNAGEIKSTVIKGVRVRNSKLATVPLNKISVVDLGTLNWNYIFSNGRMVSSSLGGIIKKHSSYIRKPNIVCAKYTTDTPQSLESSNPTNLTISIGGNGIDILIYDSSYTDATAFKSAMNGVLLYFECIEPQETISQEFVNEFVNKTIVIPQTELPSAGSVHDTIKFVEGNIVAGQQRYNMVYVSRINEYTFTGNETFVDWIGSGTSLTILLNGAVGKSGNEIANILWTLGSSTYTNNISSSPEYSISMDTTGRLYIATTKTSTELASALIHKIVQFEKAEPTETTLATDLTFEEVSAIIEQGGSIETVFEIVPPNLKTAFVVNKAIVS